MEVAQKDSAESYPGTESTFIVLLSLFVCLVSSEKILKPLYMYIEFAPVDRFLKHTSQQTVIEKCT